MVPSTKEIGNQGETGFRMDNLNWRNSSDVHALPVNGFKSGTDIVNSGRVLVVRDDVEYIRCVGNKDLRASCLTLLLRLDYII